MDFSHALASALVRADPARYTTALAKAGRERKIFIDFLRNRRGATSVSVYSTRARPGAPVSAPIAWEDLDGLGGPDLDRVPAAAQGLATGPDPWRGYFRVKQKLTSAIQKRLLGA
jgi:bifunctional non-homologous end joining protein LigD